MRADFFDTATRWALNQTVPAHKVAAGQTEEAIMPKFMLVANYTHEGAKGLAKEGATARSAAFAKTVEGLGGKLDAAYFAFGQDDVFAVIDLPDAATAAALSVNMNQTGRITARTILLMTPEEMDAALKKTVQYRAPGT